MTSCGSISSLALHAAPPRRRGWRGARRARPRRRCGSAAGVAQPGAHDPVAEREVGAGVGDGAHAAGGLQADVAAARRGSPRAGSPPPPGVALTGTLPVEVLRKSAPPASASSAARRISAGSLSSPVSRIAFSVAAAADVLDLAHRGGAPPRGGRRRASRQGTTKSISSAPSASARAGLGADVLQRRRRPSGKLTTVATRMPRAGELASACATNSGQMQTAATGPCGVSARRQSAAIAAASQSVVEVGQVEAGERPRGDVRGVGHRRDPPMCAGAKAPGSSAPTVVRARSPSRPARITGASGAANSASFCRQPPQGVTGRRAVGDHQHLGDLGAAGGDHRGDRAGLGAGALRIGDVLDVAAGEDAAVRAAHRRADPEARIGRWALARARSAASRRSMARPPGLAPDYGRGGRGLARVMRGALAMTPTGCR